MMEQMSQTIQLTNSTNFIGNYFAAIILSFAGFYCMALMAIFFTAYINPSEMQKQKHNITGS